MSTVKDKFDKFEKEARHGFNAAEKDIRHKVKHELNDNEEDVSAQVNEKEAEKGDLWERTKQQAHKLAQKMREAFNSEEEDKPTPIEKAGQDLADGAKRAADDVGLTGQDSEEI